MTDGTTITITWAVALLVIGALASVGAIAFGKSKSTRKTFGWIGGVLVVSMVIVLVLGASLPSQLGFLNNQIFGKTATIGGTTINYAISGQPSSGSNVVSVATYQPTATYSALDKFTSANVPGTGYYKVNGNKATTTAYTNTNKGDAITYWLSNGTNYVSPVSRTAVDGVTQIQAEAISNGTFTVTGYDLVQKKTISSSAYNSSMGANKEAKEELTIIGSAKTSQMPFGGVMIVEFNSSIPTASCSGDGIVGPNNRFQVTYTPTATTSRYLIYEVASGFDVSPDGNTGVTKVIRCDFSNGATAVGAGSAWYVKFLSANYYVANDGNIVLDVEKKANADTTRTGLGSTTSTFYWDA